MYSLNAATGCIHWFFNTGQGVRSAVSVVRVDMPGGARDVAFFGDATANVYALDAATGKQLWKTDVDDFPVGRISGSPTYHNGRIYVGIASGEEATGAVPTYECCKFRGSVVALDAATGKQIWKSYTIAEQPKPTKKNAVGTQLYGPSGAPVWATPAVDARLNRLLRHDWQQLQRPDVHDERFVPRDGSRHGQDSLVQADDREGRLHRRVPPA